MSRLYYHEKSDRRKWAAITIVVLLIIAAIVLGVLSNWYTDFNKYCVFGHDYGDDGKCIRCGKEKPIENEPEVEPQAFVSEPYRMNVASARPLMANNDGIAAQSTVSANAWRHIKVGDVIKPDTPISVDLHELDTSICMGSRWNIVEIMTIQAATTLYVFVWPTNTGFYYIFSTKGDECPNKTDDPELGMGVYDPNYDPSEDAYDEFSIEVPNSSTYNFYAKSFGLSGVVSDVCDEYSLAMKEVYDLPANPSKTGYTFTGWYTDQACTKKYTAQTVTADITLYAGFRAHTYTIKFNANTASGEMANLAMTYDQAKNLTANGFTKEHYAFKGWATSANGAVTYTDGQSVNNITATDGAVIELFAIWERNEVAVTFIVDGARTTTYIDLGAQATLPETPNKAGYNFLGWYLSDGTKYTSQNISEDTTLTAKFEIIRCTVTFIVDGEVYCVYECDWGTSLADALNANDVNPALLQTEDEYSRNF